ncbi:hypothetical protein B0A55_05894 [Friedmanniomyces simplex]|uniref:Uncharacterized protein n=1 Tax=Friedmanniomyces simplex TaxID=329884 RepID=A0A4U0XG67_9PEZI|nr:hypothetical protein B0A55_05894 [Friedmanniomyces simplex]
MSTPMQLDSPPRSRKRSLQHRDATDNNNNNNSSEDDDDDDLPATTNETHAITSSPKRSRNSRGQPIPRRRALHYNAQPLLNSLAYTRLYVTANFHHYYASSSPVIICLTSSFSDAGKSLYEMLCQMLPRLYGYAADLQALAIVTSRTGVGAASATATTPAQPNLDRVLPRITLSDLREDIAADLADFHETLGGPEDAIVLLESTGQCLWSSDQLDLSQTTSRDDTATTTAAAVLLQEALSEVLLLRLPGIERCRAERENVDMEL